MESNVCVSADQMNAIPPAVAARAIVLMASGARRELGQLEIAVAKAAKEWQRKVDGVALEDRPAFVPPYSTGQVEIARDYLALIEWRAGSGLRCASTAGGSGGGSGSYIDTFVQQGRILADLQDKIGSVVVMDIRRNMDRGNTRRKITARDVVDQVVVQGLDLSAVLKAHGWSPDVKSRKALRAGLCAALDRMQGLRPSVRAWQADGEPSGFRMPQDEKEA